MRIIGGKFKGKKLIEPKDKKNEVKEKPKCLINLSLSEVEHEMDGAAYYN